MRMLLRFLLTICVLPAALPAGAVVLRYQTEKGSLVRQQTALSASVIVATVVAGQRQAHENRLLFRGAYHETVGGVSDRGVISVTRTLASGSLTFRPVNAILPTRQPIAAAPLHLRISERGRLLGVRAATRPAPGARSDALAGFARALEALITHPPFPSGDLKAGDEWTEAVLLPDLWEGSAGRLTIEAQLLGVELYKDRHCATVRAAFTMPIDAPMGMLAGILPEGSLVPAAARGKGTLAARIEYRFDVARGVVMAAEGPVRIEAAMPAGILTSPGESASATSAATIVLKGTVTVNLLSQK